MSMLFALVLWLAAGWVAWRGTQWALAARRRRLGYLEASQVQQMRVRAGRMAGHLQRALRVRDRLEGRVGPKMQLAIDRTLSGLDARERTRHQIREILATRSTRSQSEEERADDSRLMSTERALTEAAESAVRTLEQLQVDTLTAGALPEMDAALADLQSASELLSARGELEAEIRAAREARSEGP